MSIPVECHCGERLSVPSDLAGKRFRCPACQANLEVPSEETPDSEESAYRNRSHLQVSQVPQGVAE